VTRGRVGASVRRHVGSRLVALARAARWRLGPPPRHREFGADDFEKLRRRADSAGHDLLLPFASGALHTLFTPAARLAVVDTSDPRVEEGLRIAEESILRMAEQCDGRCRVAVVGIPTKERVFAERVYASGEPVPKGFAELALRETLLWERVRRRLADAEIPLIDPLPPLRALLARGENPYRGDWNGHPVAAGNEAIAEAVLASGVLTASRPARSEAMPSGDRADPRS